MLTRSRNAGVSEIFERRLAISDEDHAENLRELKDKQWQIYEHVIQARLGSALMLALKLECKAGRAEAVKIIRQHTLCLIIATAHLRVASLRMYAQTPLGEGFCGHKKWVTLAHVAQATLVGPAQILKKLFSLEIRGLKTDEEARELAIKAGVIRPNGSGEEGFELSKQIRSLIAPWALEAFMPKASRMITDAIDPLSRLKTKDFQDANWTKRCFCQARIGVTPSEGTVIIAVNILCAPDRIDQCIAALEQGDDLPQFDDLPTPTWSKKALSQVTQALRTEGKPDRHAKDQMASTENNTSSKLVTESEPNLYSESWAPARAQLAITPAVWFQR